MLIEDRARDEDISKCLLPHELHARHHHARDPQEDDVARSDEHRGWIESFQVLRVVGPTERRNGPERSREPSVEHVRVLS